MGLGKKKKQAPALVKNKGTIQKKTIQASPYLIWILASAIALCGILLYANTFHHGYTVDDPTVTTKNVLVQKGLQGIPTILKTSYWHGYSRLKEANNYRPLTLVMLAAEWHLFPDQPEVYHIVNVLLFALTGFLLFLTLSKMFAERNLILPFAISLLYVAHPIHTEVVANIKSRDEILVFLLTTASSFFLLSYIEKKRIGRLLLAVVCYFLALLSKENAVTFLATIPLMLYFFTKIPLRKNVILTLIYVVTLGCYLFLRAHILGDITGEGKLQSETNVGLDAASIMNNALMGAPDTPSRLATTIHIMGRYIWLLIFPHPLSWDYSFNQIPIVSWLSPKAVIPLLIYLFMAFYVIRNFIRKEKDPIVFGILFFVITVSLVSNIFLLIKSTMAERFMFMPSLGFCMALAILLTRITRTDTVKNNFSNAGMMLKKNTGFFIPLTVILGLYAFKTIDRNKDWKDNYTLYKKDTKSSPNSARTHYMYAMELLDERARKESDPEKRNAYLNETLEEFKKTMAIFPLYPDVQKNFERANRMKDPSKMLQSYFDAIQKNPNDPSAYNSLGVYYGGIGEFEKAAGYLKKAVELKPSTDGYNNLGNAYAGLGKYREALQAYKKCLEMNPNNTQVYGNIGSTYGNLKDFDSSIYFFKKILDADPANSQIHYYIGLSYQNKGDKESAKMYFDKATQLNKTTQPKSNK